ncbi:MAG: hypothetical protein C0467_25310 [Planctomycetaceae bacterium]|nr:hypothetical protein [Planctomycetaceae bacterium]
MADNSDDISGVLKALGAVAAPLTALTAKFAAIAGPMAVFGQILESNASGFQALSGAVKVLAGTLAPVLLPGVAVVAAGFVHLGDKLWNEIAPELENFYAAVVDDMVPAVEAMVEAFMDAVRWLKRNNSITSAGSAVDDVIAAAGGKSFTGAESGVGATKGTGGGGGRGGVMGSAMGDVLKELRLSMGPRASIGDIGGVGKNFQLAALNQSPFETKMLERMDKAVSALERVAGRGGRRDRAAYTGTGAFTGAEAGGTVTDGGID